MKKLFIAILALVSLSAFAADRTFNDHIENTRSLFQMLSDGTNHPNRKLGKRYSNKVCELALTTAARNVGYQLLFLRLGFDAETRAQMDQISDELENVSDACKKRSFKNGYKRLKLKNVGGMMYDSQDALKGLEALDKKAIDAGFEGVQGMIDLAMWAQKASANVLDGERVEDTLEPSFKRVNEAQAGSVDA